MHRHTGFTLIELLTVIVIIGILSGMVIISSSSAIDIANKNKCITNCNTLKSGINVYRAYHGSNTFTPEMVASLKHMFNKPIGNISISGQTITIKDLCPAGGVYTIKEKDSKVYVNCSLREHGGEWTSHKIAEALITDANVRDYFASKGDGAKLDSEAPTISTVTTGKAELVNNDLRKLGIDIDNVSWQVHKVGSGYHIYITDSKITTASIGERVNVTKYNYITGTVTVGRITVEKSTRADYPVLATHSFQQTGPSDISLF